jgi:hypothetical protein
MTAMALGSQGLALSDYDVNPKAPASSTLMPESSEAADSTRRAGFGTWFLFVAVAAGTVGLLSVGE